MKVLFGVYIFVLGSIFASFFGVIIDRVPRNLSIVKPSSRCDNCGHVLKWYENIPVFSFLFLKGRCSKCHERIGTFSFIYEVIGGLSLLLVYLKYGLTIECLLVILISLVMLLIAGYDYKTHRILNVCLWVLLGSCVLLLIYRVCFLKYSIVPYILSVVLAVLFFLLLKIIMNKILNKESLGSGDIYMVGIMGLVFEPFELVLSILIASLSGSIISLLKIKFGKNQRDDEIAFCPYLCFGFYMMFIFGNVFIKLLLR